MKYFRAQRIQYLLEAMSLYPPQMPAAAGMRFWIAISVANLAATLGTYTK